MSAARLREAAGLMRERASGARAGCWEVAPSNINPDATLVVARWTDMRRVVTCDGSLPEGNAANAEHIASWHPAVALAVADLLAIVEAGYEDYRPNDPAPSQMQIVSAWADNLADAYLGTTR